MGVSTYLATDNWRYPRSLMRVTVSAAPFSRHIELGRQIHVSEERSVLLEGDKI
jgi:hypothetical protein